MIGIVVSRADEASERLGEQLLALRDWEERDDGDRDPADGGGTYHRSAPFERRTFDDLHLDLDGVAAAFDDPDLVVFASRHSGETGPLLTGHFTGNFGPAEYGGADRELAVATPAALAAVLSAFDEHAPADYETGIECTHHGPSEVGAPSLFVELGSGPDEWADPGAAAAVARAILALEEIDGPWTDRTVVGIGGGHYAKRFERVLRETGWTVGHVAADWGLAAMGDPREHEAVVRQLFEQSGATRAVVDGDHDDLEAVVRDLGFEVVSETWLRAVDGVDLELAGAVESELTAVDDGLRFGAPARERAGGERGSMDEHGGTEDEHGTDAPGGVDFEVVDLPDELLGAARGIDRDRTRAAVESHVLAFETSEGASKAEGRGAVADVAALDRLADELVDVLAERYDRVERDGDEIVAHERAFDPARARELGVPEGPAFGRLANGESVDVDGDTVAPGDVTVDRTDTFPVR